MPWLFFTHSKNPRFVNCSSRLWHALSRSLARSLSLFPLSILRNNTNLGKLEMKSPMFMWPRVAISSCHNALLKVKPRTEYNSHNMADSRKYIIAFENTMLPKYVRWLGQSGNWKPYRRDFIIKLAGLWDKPFSWYYLGQMLGQPKPQKTYDLSRRAHSFFIENPGHLPIVLSKPHKYLDQEPAPQK